MVPILAGTWNNEGCNVMGPNGTAQVPFNNAGGGVFAMEWVNGTNPYISIWYFLRANIPADITAVREKIKEKVRA